MRYFAIVAAFGLLLAVTGTAEAVSGGSIITDRFGYSGTVYRYGSLSDAQSDTNRIDTVLVGDRDLSLWVVKNDPAVYSDSNIVMGSWWYSADSSGNPGWGNTRGNTGVGFMQIYDIDGSTDTNIDMAFGGYDGTHYTEFDLTLAGQNTVLAEDFGRFSVYDNVNDGGVWHEYSVALAATGLQGVPLGGGVIQAANHPTGVSGSISGIFEITENQTSPANQGFYSIDLTLSMTNWAWEQDQTGTLTYPADGEIYDSLFRTVPEPVTMAGLVMGVGGLVGYVRRRKA